MAKLWLKASDNYEVETDLYSGPLDLLINLIQRAELDISKLALAQVTDQFLAYIAKHQNADATYLSEFMVIASKLVQIKSEAMLPRPSTPGEEEGDPGEELAQQLLLYREIKNAGLWLNQRNDEGLRSYIHIPQSYPVNTQIDFSNVSLTELISALQKLLLRAELDPENVSISIPKLTLRHRVQSIIKLLRESGQTSFSVLIGEENKRLNIIVTFLAILELIKQDLISTEQSEAFADIHIQAKNTLFLSDDDDILVED